MSRSLVLAAALMLLMGLSQAKYHGDGTAYSGDGEKDKTGFNACQFGGIGDHWERYYAAMPVGMFDKDEHCGRCANVCGKKGCIKVKIVDSCASCNHGDIDLSTDALEACTGYEWDRKPVTWSFVDCGGSKGTKKGRKASAGSKKKKGKKGKKQE